MWTMKETRRAQGRASEAFSGQKFRAVPSLYGGEAAAAAAAERRGEARRGAARSEAEQKSTVTST